ncbi:Uncharacterised protein [Kluyvera ascorbata]|nr:Uncharacterised protein [Kluyvera ascorbata]STX00652.1 Uncharacterised protein [Kluyvera ascorbata]
MNQLTDKRVAEILARAEICDDSVLTDYADIVLAMRELQEHRKAAGATQNSRSSAKVQVVQEQIGTTHVPEPGQSVEQVDGESLPSTQTAPTLDSSPKNAGLLPGINPTLVNDVTSGKPLTITLPDISSKAFLSGTGKHEVFHPETYKRWVKEAIERDCTIAKIEVKVK